MLVLSDARVADGRAVAPILLSVAAVQRRLVDAGLRTKTSLLVDSDEPRESHHFACLIGYGADAICPRLALETVAQLAADDKLGGDHPSAAPASPRRPRSKARPASPSSSAPPVHAASPRSSRTPAT